MSKEKSVRHSDVVAIMRAVAMYHDMALPPVLPNMNFAVRRGEVFGVVGPKGSGKSTTLGILAGRLAQTYGEVKIFGTSPRRRSIQRRIGYVPGPAGRFFEARPIGIFGFLRGVFGPRWRHQPAIGQPPAPRGAALAQALARAPDLLILDEPFLGLDPGQAGELRDLILTLARRGKTLIISGDSLADLKHVCGRIAVLEDGRLEAIGTIEELLAKPGAVRFFASMICAGSLERLLEIVRQDLTSGQVETPPSDHPPVIPFLSEPPSSVAGSSPDSIDHRKLADLVRPSTQPSPLAGRHE